jgi:glycosyltransferase involved in cell wall biosynthesis
MKILILPSWYYNNSNINNGVFFKEQALALKKKDNDVSLVFFDCRSLKHFLGDLRSLFFYNSSCYEDELFTFRKNGLNLFNYRSNLGKKIWIKFYFNTVSKYIKLYGKPDIIYCHSYMSGYVAMKIKQKYSINYIIAEHSSEILKCKLNKNIIKLIDKSYQNSSCLISVSFNLSKEIYTKFKFNSLVIPNSINFNNFFPKSIKKDKILICISSFIPRKNLSLLIDSFFLSKVYESGWVLNIIGEGCERELIQNKINFYKLNNKIFLLGTLNREQIIKELNLASIFCFTSFFETFGVVFIEAMAMGLPILTTPCGSANELIDYNNGIINEDFDKITFSKKIIYMTENFKNYNSLKIRELARNIYDDEVVSKITYDLLQNNI